MATAYEKAAARMEAEKKASEKLRKKAAKSVKKAEYQGGPARQAIKEGTRVKTRQGWVSKLKKSVKTELKRMNGSVKPKENKRTKQVKTGLKSSLTPEEIKRLSRKG